MTSPSVPVSWTFPRPFTTLTSISSTSPPAASIGESRSDTDLVLERCVIGIERRRSEQFLEIVDARRVCFAVASPRPPPAFAQLSRNPRDPALQLAHAGFTRIATHDRRQNVAAPNVTSSFVESVRLDLPRQQILPRDRHLLVIQITGEANDLHSVAQRLGNAGQTIRGRDEQHLREIVVDFEVVVVEVVFCSGSRTSSSAAAGSPR